MPTIPRHDAAGCADCTARDDAATPELGAAAFVFRSGAGGGSILGSGRFVALWPGLVRAWHDQGVAADHVPGGRGPLIAAHDVVAPVDIATGWKSM